MIDSASAPGDGATRDDPFIVDTEGSVEWSGSTEAAITDGSWSVTIAGIRAFSGSINDQAAERVKGGNQSLAGLPAVVAAMLQGEQVIPAEGEIIKDGAVLCTASGYITGTGSATSSPLFYGGVALAAAGVGLGVGVFAGTRAQGGAVA